MNLIVNLIEDENTLRERRNKNKEFKGRFTPENERARGRNNGIKQQAKNPNINKLDKRLRDESIIIIYPTPGVTDRVPQLQVLSRGLRQFQLFTYFHINMKNLGREATQ